MSTKHVHSVSTCSVCARVCARVCVYVCAFAHILHVCVHVVNVSVGGVVCVSVCANKSKGFT